MIKAPQRPQVVSPLSIPLPPRADVPGHGFEHSAAAADEAPPAIAAGRGSAVETPGTL